MTNHEPDRPESTTEERQLREDEQTPLELEGETLSDLSTDDDVVGGISSQCQSG